jgi:fluoride exporter
MLTWMGIAVGGALGTLARYWIALWAAPISQWLPWGTVGINVIGSFVIAFVGTLTVPGGAHPAPEPLRLFVTVGLCGGFTTFSSFSLQTFDLLRGGAWSRACINIGLSVSSGPRREDQSGPELRWKRRRSDHHENQAACCCCGCGDVGNALALSKRSVISTALSPSAPVMPSRQTVIGVRLFNAWCGRPVL